MLTPSPPMPRWPWLTGSQFGLRDRGLRPGAADYHLAALVRETANLETIGNAQFATSSGVTASR